MKFQHTIFWHCEKSSEITHIWQKTPLFAAFHSYFCPFFTKACFAAFWNLWYIRLSGAWWIILPVFRDYTFVITSFPLKPPASNKVSGTSFRGLRLRGWVLQQSSRLFYTVTWSGAGAESRWLRRQPYADDSNDDSAVMTAPESARNTGKDKG